MDNDALAALRTEYSRAGLDEADVDSAGFGHDPVGLFGRWLDEAVSAGVHEPNAMALATADARGRPSVRIVLLKSLDEHGAVFHTNYESRKGQELAANPWASAVLLWHPIQRQVRLEGPVSRLGAQESDRYFLSRPEGGRISAAASPQSRVVADRAELRRRWDEASAEDAAGERPSFWGGLRIGIESIEFWQGRENRLHDRLRWRREGGDWVRDRLAP